MTDLSMFGDEVQKRYELLHRLSPRAADLGASYLESVAGIVHASGVVSYVNELLDDDIAMYGAEGNHQMARAAIVLILGYEFCSERFGYVRGE